MRTCSRCGEDKAIEQFPERAVGSGRRHGHCRECKAAYQRAWYARNRERHKANVATLRRARMERHQALVREAKDRACADCGVRYPPYVMDLDHVRGEKLGAIAELVSSATTAALRAEIAKCEVVCANCHRERTFGDDASAWHRRAVPWSMAGSAQRDDSRSVRVPNGQLDLGVAGSDP